METACGNDLYGDAAWHTGYSYAAPRTAASSFGEAPFFGSLGANPPAQPIVSVAILNQ